MHLSSPNDHLGNFWQLVTTSVFALFVSLITSCTSWVPRRFWSQQTQVLEVQEFPDPYTAVCSSPRAILTDFLLAAEATDAVSLFFGFFRLDLIGLLIEVAELYEPVEPKLSMEVLSPSVVLRVSMEPPEGAILTLLPMGLEETPMGSAAGT